MEKSRKNFIDDQLIRSNEFYDQIYRFTSDLRGFIDSKGKLDYCLLHDIIKKYIENNCMILGEKILKTEYHKRFGWIIENKKSKAYLGKMIFAGSPKINIGRFSYFSGKSAINGCGQFSIGSFTSIANGLQLFLSNINHPMQFPTTYNLHSNARLIESKDNIDLPNFQKEIETLNEKRDISIGNDVWIGRDVMIMNGIEISDGCIIGARSTITKDCKPYGVYVGTPAKLIKYRFNKEVIDQLLEIKWWNWDIKAIKKNKKFFNTNINDYNKPLNTILNNYGI